MSFYRSIASVLIDVLNSDSEIFNVLPVREMLKIATRKLNHSVGIIYFFLFDLNRSLVLRHDFNADLVQFSHLHGFEEKQLDSL